MAEHSKGSRKIEYQEIGLEKIEEIRSRLNERKARLTVNQQILFKHTAALPPAKRAGVWIAGWGPIVLFPFAPVLYFIEWKLALLTIFLCIFWVGMGRKFAQATILKQCHADNAFLKFALTVGLVKLA